jgi:DNA-binding response OmpR family regulator
VVDDDAALRTVLIASLRDSGYRVSDAEDGEAAWGVLCSDSVDVLITDHDIPRLTGLDLLRRVRAGPLQLPVILISGEMPWNERDLLSLLPPGVALEKPFSLADLQAHVASLLTPMARPHDDHNGQTWLAFGSSPPPLPVHATG